VTREEHGRWREAASKEAERYGVDRRYVNAGLEGKSALVAAGRRSGFDWFLIVLASAVFIGMAAYARAPQIDVSWGAVVALSVAMLLVLVMYGVALWKTTRFN
jgi:hypothetical protein